MIKEQIIVTDDYGNKYTNNEVLKTNSFDCNYPILYNFKILPQYICRGFRRFC